MKTVDLIERIEGEAKLHCVWKNKKIVDAISKVMEGGEKAFKYRANFYGI